MITDPPPTDSTVVPAPRKKLDSEFNEEENKLEMADTQAEIILSQVLSLLHSLRMKRFDGHYDSDIASLNVFKSMFPPNNNQLRTPPTQGLNVTVHDGHIVTNQIRRSSRPIIRWHNSDLWMKGPNAAVAFHGQLVNPLVQPTIQSNEEHSNDNQIFEMWIISLSEYHSSRTAYRTEKLSALTTQHTKLQAQVTGKTSSGPSTSETPKVLAPGMYNLGVKPTSGASKTVPKRAPRNHSSLPAKSANARRVEAPHRTLNKQNRVDSNLLVKHSVSVSNLNNTKRLKRQPKKEWKPIKNVGKHIKRVWKPISKLVANSKPQWKPTGRHFSLYEMQVPKDDSGQFCDRGLEVAFRQHSCHIRNYDTVDLLTGSRTTNLYSISLNDMITALSERTERTLMEAARTMLIFAKAPLFLWAEAVATACYTLNRSLVHTLHGKTYYELLKGKKPNLQYFRVFGSLCYPTNDYDDVGKLKAKADIGLAPQQITYVPNSTELELTALQFDDDEVVPITPVNVPAAPAPENGHGFTFPHTFISEGPPTVTESLLPHQMNLYQPTSDSDDNIHITSRSNGISKLILDECGDCLEESKHRLEAIRLFIAHAASIKGHLPDGRENRLLNCELNEVVPMNHSHGSVESEGLRLELKAFSDADLQMSKTHGETKTIKVSDARHAHILTPHNLKNHEKLSYKSSASAQSLKINCLLQIAKRMRLEEDTSSKLPDSQQI
ncbi:integrase, catalytic region, zinc finger, CCHC-type containing protein [Tanacetum coccineum]|uniref:Integrase, catalytic region, zinc finger, CCHC-type containing protein n=1 Tax=Tanacetum coccineum TaxID=301880 RepID=A0ABQ5IJ75_9ASTR